MQPTDYELMEATAHDVPTILEIVRGAQRRLAAAGIDQWQNGYPNREVIENDIRSSVARVVCHEGRVVAYGAVVYTGERAYEDLRGGEWLTKGTNYATVHRLCVAESSVGRGVGRGFMELVEVDALRHDVASVRVDTHPDNKTMQHLLDSLGYIYCGVVCYESERLAYEKMVVGSL